MKARPLYILSALLLACLLLSSFGCSRDVLSLHSPVPEPSPEEAEVSMPEQIDSACSYFYFLWGFHAENNKRFQEAKEAYEKALICDPDSRYILRRLPILLITMNMPFKAAQQLRENIKRFPDEIQDRLLLARLDVRNGEIEEAIQLYREIIQLSPDDEISRLRLGVLFSQQNNISEAEKMFRQALDLNPQSLFAHLYLARLAIQAGDMNQAEVWYSKALAINWSVELSLEVAEFYGSRKEYAKVEQQYREILSQYPDDTRASLGLIHALVLQNKKTDALTELQNLRKESSDPSQIDIFTARLHLRSGETEKAAQLLESVVSQGDEPEAIYMLAVILYQEKEVVRAMELLETINQQSDYYEDSLYLRVRILLDRNKKMEAVTLIKKNMNSGMASDPDLYSLLASLYVELNREQEGYDIMASGIEQYPENPNLHYEYGLLLERGDRQEEAVVQMQKVLELVPDHAEALNYIGYTWANKNINLKQALEYIERALKLKPESGYILDSLGWIYFRMGELEKAEREVLKALEQNPDDPHMYEHLGDIYRARGKKEEAREAYKKGEELFNDGAGKKRMQEKLNGLQ